MQSDEQTKWRNSSARDLSAVVSGDLHPCSLSTITTTKTATPSDAAQYPAWSNSSSVFSPCPPPCSILHAQFPVWLQLKDAPCPERMHSAVAGGRIPGGDAQAIDLQGLLLWLPPWLSSLACPSANSIRKRACDSILNGASPTASFRWWFAWKRSAKTAASPSVHDLRDESWLANVC